MGLIKILFMHSTEVTAKQMCSPAQPSSDQEPETFDWYGLVILVFSQVVTGIVYL